MTGVPEVIGHWAGEEDLLDDNKGNAKPKQDEEEQHAVFLVPQLVVGTGGASAVSSPSEGERFASGPAGSTIRMEPALHPTAFQTRFLIIYLPPYGGSLLSTAFFSQPE